MSRRRDEDLVALVKNGQRIVVDASDEAYFARLVRDGWEEQGAVVAGPGSLCGHATSVASRFGKDSDAT